MSAAAQPDLPVMTENDHVAAGLQRIDGIDLLRGLSILAVVIHHIALRIPLRRTVIGKLLPAAIVNDLSWNGYNGVIIFFAISGFLITTNCLRRWGSLSNIKPREFYRMRFARIAPLLLGLLSALSILHLLHVPVYTINPQRASLPRALLAALTFHVNWLEAHRGYLPANWDVLWSLSNEEMFYLFFPIVCLLTRSRALLVCILFAFVFAGPSARTVLTHNRLWADYGYFSAMDAIAIGCLAALICRSLSFSKGERRAIQTTGAVLVAFITLFRGQVEALGLYKMGIDASLLASGTALMLISFTQSQKPGSRIAAPLRWFGRNSYEVYLTHCMVIFAILPLVTRVGADGWFTPIWYAAMIVGSGFLGAAIAKYFSEPMNRKLRAKTTLAKSQAA